MVKHYPYSVIGQLIWRVGISGTDLLAESKLEIERVERFGGIWKEIEKHRIKSKLVTIKRALDDLETYRKRAIGMGYHGLAEEADLHISLISQGLLGIIERAGAVGLELPV